MSTENKSTDKIYLIYQFFIHNNEERNKELRKCLRFNVENPHIDKIYLLNEKLYNDEELGVVSDKIDQRNIVNRLKFKDVFEFVETEKINGYIVTINADIFLDKTLNNLKKTEMSSKKQIMAQLRFDYTNKKLGKCKLFGPRADSQDTWIFHSKFNPYKESRIFNFIFGQPGCDNRLIYLFSILGFEVFNQPHLVKTYHIQKDNARNYGAALSKPYMQISPFIQNQHSTHTKIWGTVGERLLNNHQTTIETITLNFSRFMFQNDNITMGEYLKTTLENKKKFLIPMTEKKGFILTSIAFMINKITNGTFFKESRITQEYQDNPDVVYLWKTLSQIMHSGLNKIPDLVAYVRYYIKAFVKADICVGFSTWDTEYRSCMLENTNNLYKSLFVDLKHKKWLSISVSNIFNYIHHNPWIKQLDNHKIVIISPHSDEIEQQIKMNELKELYGVDIFAGCEFEFIKFSQWSTLTQEQLSNTNGEIVLCDCDIYGSVVAEYVHGIGKSVIDVGEMLPLYFGLWNQSDLVYRKDILTLYMNKKWRKLDR